MAWLTRVREVGKAVAEAVRKHGPKVKSAVDGVRAYRVRRDRRARQGDLDDSLATLETLRRRD